MTISDLTEFLGIEEVTFEDASDEIAALLLLKDAVSDYLLGLDNAGFAKEYGGVPQLLREMRQAFHLYETEFNEDE